MSTRTRGFTLVELMVTLTIAASLAAMSIPSFGTWIANMRMRAMAESLQQSLLMARGEAVTRNGQAMFALSNDMPSLAAAPAVNGGKWFVRGLPLADGGTVNAHDFVQGGDFSGHAVVITGPAAVCFDSIGRLTAHPAANCAGPTEAAYDIVSARADRRLRVKVSVAGHVRMCDPDKSWALGQTNGC